MPSTSQTQPVKHSYGVPLHATHITMSINGVETDVPIRLIAAAPAMYQIIMERAKAPCLRTDGAHCTMIPVPPCQTCRARALLEEING